MLRDLDTIVSNLAYWAEVESWYLRADIVNNFDSLKFNLISLYTNILKLEVELVRWVSDSRAGMSLRVSCIYILISRQTSAGLQLQ